MQTKTGDSVRVRRVGGSLRFDVGDAEALQGLVYEAMARAFGGLVGVGSGCLYVPSFDTTDLANVSVGECVFFWAYPAGGTALKNAEGFVLRHNPGLSGQLSTVNLAPYAAGEGTPYLWARRVEIETTPGPRKKATSPPFAEVDDNTATRYEERVEFEVGNANPDAAAGWFAFARVTAWGSGGVDPVIRVRSPFDAASDDLFTTSKGVRHRALETLSYNDFGLRGFVTALLVAITRMMDSAWEVKHNGDIVTAGTKSWLDYPVRGLLQLHNDLDSTGARIDAVDSRIDGVDAVIAPVLWHGRVLASGDATQLFARPGITVSHGYAGGHYTATVIPGAGVALSPGLPITAHITAVGSGPHVPVVHTEATEAAPTLEYSVRNLSSGTPGVGTDVAAVHYLTIFGRLT